MSKKRKYDFNLSGKPIIDGPVGESVFVIPHFTDMDDLSSDIQEKLKFVKETIEELNDDVSLVIHSINMIETIIEEILYDFLSIKESKRKDWGKNTNFDTKLKHLKVGNGLPYIPKHIYYSIKSLNQIRNKFSHQLKYKSFKNFSGIKGSIIKHLKMFYPDFDKEDYPKTSDQYRILVITVSMSLFYFYIKKVLQFLRNVWRKEKFKMLLSTDRFNILSPTEILKFIYLILFFHSFPPIYESLRWN